MNILLITGSLLPQPGNNTNLLSKLIPYLKEHTLHILAPAGKGTSLLPDTVFGLPVHWMVDNRRDSVRRIIYPALAKLTDQNGYSDAIQSMLLLETAKKLRRDYPFDVVISTMEPFSSGCTAIKLTNCKKVLYLMDPPA